jgi:hypothetical protein
MYAVVAAIPGTLDPQQLSQYAFDNVGYGDDGCRQPGDGCGVFAVDFPAERLIAAMFA